MKKYDRGFHKSSDSCIRWVAVDRHDFTTDQVVWIQWIKGKLDLGEGGGISYVTGFLNIFGFVVVMEWLL